MDEKVYKIALAQFCKFSITRTKQILAHVGGVRPFFDKKQKELADILGVKEKMIAHYKRDEALEKAYQEMIFMKENGIQYHFYKDKNYPAGLKFCEDSPLILFSKGKIDFSRHHISIVGTRKATPYGQKVTREFVQNIAHYPVQIVSGLAHGIDRIAHEAALENELPTIAVLGHGFDLIYPAAHRGLAKKMQSNGGLITEYMSFTPGDPSHFPRRNRIVAGMSEATIVIESGEKGGSLITANMANSYNREVFAVPGDIHRPYSRGCHALIQQNKAHLLYSAQDFLDIMEWDEPGKRDQLEQASIFDALTREEEKLFVLLKSSPDPLHIDRIGNESGLSPSEVSLNLFNLEMRGSIRSLPGKYYQSA